MKTNQEKIDTLVRNLLDVCYNDSQFWESLIREGFKGYEKMSATEINTEYQNCMEKEK